jgi:hypothetical protein
MRKCLSASPVRRVFPARPTDAHNVPDFRDNQHFGLKISKTRAIMREFGQKTRGKFAKRADFSMKNQFSAKATVRRVRPVDGERP